MDSYIHLQFTQIMERKLEVGIGFAPQRHGAEMPGVVTDFADETFDMDLSSEKSARVERA